MNKQKSNKHQQAAFLIEQRGGLRVPKHRPTKRSVSKTHWRDELIRCLDPLGDDR